MSWHGPTLSSVERFVLCGAVYLTGAETRVAQIALVDEFKTIQVLRHRVSKSQACPTSRTSDIQTSVKFSHKAMPTGTSGLSATTRNLRSARDHNEDFPREFVFAKACVCEP